VQEVFGCCCVRMESVVNVVGVAGGTQKERVRACSFLWANHRSWRLLHSRSGSTAHAFLVIWNLFLIKKTKRKKERKKERMRPPIELSSRKIKSHNNNTRKEGTKERRLAVTTKLLGM